MNSKRIKEIQESIIYINSISIQQALLKVWYECKQEQSKKIKKMYNKGFEDGCRTASDDISSRI